MLKDRITDWVHPLLDLVHELVQYRCPHDWAILEIKGQMTCGMMLTSCTVVADSGKSTVIPIPVEHCDRLKLLAMRQLTKKPIDGFHFRLKPSGKYEFESF